MEEITAAIQAWMKEGDHVVLGLDANEDVRFGTVQKDLANVWKFEAIIRHHPTKSVPATCNKNLSRMLIDGIWTSPGVEVLRCGYLPFDSYDGFSSDHHVVGGDRQCKHPWPLSTVLIHAFRRQNSIERPHTSRQVQSARHRGF